MKIIIDYDDCQWPIDIEKPPQENLDLLLDTFTQPQVRTIINEALRTFRGMCDIWNQRELSQRREFNQDAGTSPVEGE